MEYVVVSECREGVVDVDSECWEGVVDVVRGCGEGVVNVGSDGESMVVVSGCMED